MAAPAATRAQAPLVSRRPRGRISVSVLAKRRAASDKSLRGARAGRRSVSMGTWYQTLVRPEGRAGLERDGPARGEVVVVERVRHVDAQRHVVGGARGAEPQAEAVAGMHVADAELLLGHPDIAGVEEDHAAGVEEVQ